MKMPRRLFFTLVYCLISIGIYGQVNHRYEQDNLNKKMPFSWLTLGGDLHYLHGKTTQQVINGVKQTTNFGISSVPRFTIGGVHFWGHVDTHITIPLSFLTLQDVPQGLDEIEVYQGVETGIRFYPLKLKPKSFSPFLGLSLRHFRFSQESEEQENSVPSYGRLVQPIQFGLTYTSKKWHISASSYYNFQDEFNYYINLTEIAEVKINPLSFNFSVSRIIVPEKFFAKRKPISLTNKERKIKNKRILSDWFQGIAPRSSWFLGIGASMALETGKSSYLKKYYPFFYNDYRIFLLPDLSLGRYFHEAGVNINLSHRTYDNTYEGFDKFITIQRHSVGIESVKYLFRYLGFTTFAGIIISRESLNTIIDGINNNENKTAFGFTMGWDIRLNKSATSFLRTNLRYYPKLNTEIKNEKMRFDYLDINFIQFIQFFGKKR